MTTAPLTDDDVDRLFRVVVPDWLIERLDTKLGTDKVVPLIKQHGTYGHSGATPDGPYSDGRNPEWWAFRVERDTHGFDAEVIHEYRDDRPTEVLRAGRITWNRLANMSTIAALELKRRAREEARDELAQRSDVLDAKHARLLAEIDRTPVGRQAPLIKQLDGLANELAEVERRLEAAADDIHDTERTVSTMSSTATTTERKPRGPLTLKRPVKNTLDGSSLVQAKRSQQIHVLPADQTRTLCNIDTAKWSDEPTVHETGKVTCPLCAKAMKEAGKPAKGDVVDEAGAESDGDAS